MLSADWKSPSKIIARSGPGKGKGDIIVTTRSGGQGTCTVGFKGYHVQIGVYIKVRSYIVATQSKEGCIAGFKGCHVYW